MNILFSILMVFTSLRAKNKEKEIDETLIERIGKGDEEAFDEFYRESERILYAFLLSYTKNHDLALDIMHDTYIKIRNSAHLYKAQGKPLAWVFTIGKNLAKDHFSREGRFQNFELEDSLDFSYVEDPLDKLVLESALKILSEEEMQIVTMFAISGYKHKEIANSLNLKQNTVISKYNRALKKLREFIEREVENE